MFAFMELTAGGRARGEGQTCMASMAASEGYALDAVAALGSEGSGRDFWKK